MTRYTAQEMLDEAGRLAWIIRLDKFGIRHKTKGETIRDMLHQAAADLRAGPTMDLKVLVARLNLIRDTDPPMSIIGLNQLIEEIEHAINSGKVQVRSE
jgi:hypothetical protein